MDKLRRRKLRYYFAWGFFTSIILTSCTKELFYLPKTIQEEMDKAVESGFDGMIVYVNQAGNSTFYSAGWKNREEQIPADPHALFKIGSISKLYIAAATTKSVCRAKKAGICNTSTYSAAITASCSV